MPNLIQWPRISKGFFYSEMNEYGRVISAEVYGDYQTTFDYECLIGINLFEDLKNLTDSPDRILYAIAIARQQRKPYSFGHKIGQEQKDQPRIARIGPGQKLGSTIIFQYTLKP